MLPSRLMITGHEGDLMHMLDAALRMAHGEMPHLDFMTPIGVLGFAPVAGFLALGVKVGKATLMAEAAMLALMLPAIWWVAATRFNRGQAYYFGVVMVVTMMAVVYGGGSASISLSMYYNRWGWSITFLILATILFPSRRALGEGWVAPLVIGIGMAALAMLKVTFFVPLLPVVPLILVAQKQGRVLVRALIVGVLVGVGLLGWLGFDFFSAYFRDLLAVTRPEATRADTWPSITSTFASSRTLMTALIMFFALMLFRKTGRMTQGVVVLLLAPAFAYITYQNWGNDPKWLHLVVLYMWANLPDLEDSPVFGIAARPFGLALIVAAFTFIFPSIVSMGTSTFRAAVGANADGFSKLALVGDVSDIWLPKRRAEDIFGVQAIEGWPTLSSSLSPLEIEGFTFPDCQLSNSLVAQYVGMAQQIEAVDEARGQPVLVADVLNFLWLVGDVARVPGAAPWYYGDDAGLAQAAYLAVPLCATKPSLRSAMMAQVEAGGYGLAEIYRSELMVLYALSKPAE